MNIPMMSMSLTSSHNIAVATIACKKHVHPKQVIYIFYTQYMVKIKYDKGRKINHSSIPYPQLLFVKKQLKTLA